MSAESESLPPSVSPWSTAVTLAVLPIVVPAVPAFTVAVIVKVSGVAVETVPTPVGKKYRVSGTDGADLRTAIYGLAREEDWPLQELYREVRTLETVFNELATAASDPDTSEGGGQE